MHFDKKKQEINAFFRSQSRYFADFCLYFANFCFNFRFFHGLKQKKCKKTRFWELLLPKSRLFTQQTHIIMFVDSVYFISFTILFTLSDS